MKMSWLIDIEPLYGLSDQQKFIDDIADQCSYHSVVIWHLLWESYTVNSDDLGALVQATRRLNPSIKIVLIVDRYFEKNIEFFMSLGINQVLVIDFFLLASMLRIKNLNHNQSVLDWNLNSKKFLFLTGKPEKIHRIRLLWKFYRADLIQRMQWSLFVDDSSKFRCQDILPELSIEELESFVQQHQRNPDNIKVARPNSNFSLHYPGVPFDPKIYQDCLFQVISETSFNNTSTPWITEKTYLAMINHRPFIIAGDVGILSRLSSDGFRTFENYLQIPEYDKICDPELRLTAIVKNAQNWLETISNQSGSINQDVKYNYTIVLNLFQKNVEILQNCIDSNDLKCLWTDILEIFDDFNLEKLFRIWYQNIKDPSWPDCTTRAGWHNLPEHIKQECVEIFGYNP